MKNEFTTNFTLSDVEIKTCETVYQGYFKINSYSLRHQRFAGGWSDVFQREVFERGNSVAVLPYDPQRDEVVLIRQFRIGALSDKSPWLIETVAGMMGAEETNPEDVAYRESIEEANLKLHALKPLYNYWVSPGGSSERMFLYCARVSAENLSGIYGLAHEHEDIEVFVWPRERAFEAIQTGEINNSISIMALQWLQLNYKNLSQEWSEPL